MCDTELDLDAILAIEPKSPIEQAMKDMALRECERRAFQRAWYERLPKDSTATIRFKKHFDDV